MPLGDASQNVLTTIPFSGSSEWSQVTRSGADKFPNPFFDIASEYMPRDLNQIFEYCEYLYLSNGTYRQAARRVVRYFLTELVLEGGALEVDGRGTAIITRSCVLNDNRNRGWTADRVEVELARLLGIRKLIWLPGIAGKDITDGHTDFYARFTAPGVVVAALDEDADSYDHEVTKEHLAILEAATDSEGRNLTVETLVAPRDIRQDFAGDDFAAGYVNFYLCNGAVIAPEFGDQLADRAAAETLRRLFPGREVVQVAIDGIAAGGGGIHCATQQQPEVLA